MTRYEPLLWCPDHARTLVHGSEFVQNYISSRTCYILRPDGTGAARSAPVMSAQRSIASAYENGCTRVSSSGSSTTSVMPGADRRTCNRS